MKTPLFTYLMLLLISLGLSPKIKAQVTPPNTTCTIYFDYDQYKLSTTEKSRLETFAQTLNQRSNTYRIELIGHTDADGNREYNEVLSMNRCKTIQQYFEEKGWQAEQFKKTAWYFAKPAASNRTSTSKAKNRRVEIIVSQINSFNTNLKENDLSANQKNNTIDINAPILQTAQFDAKKGIEFRYNRSGTKIYIPQNALMHKDGSPVTGQVDIAYTEFRDVADFIFSDISMMYHEHAFNSAGMFELRVSQNGEELLVQPGQSYNMDFQMTDQLPNVGFFQYDKVSNQWTQLGNLESQNEAFVGAEERACETTYFDVIPQNIGKKLKDTLDTYKKLVATGLFLASTQSNFLQEVYYNKIPSFDQAWEMPENYSNPFLELNQFKIREMYPADHFKCVEFDCPTVEITKDIPLDISVPDNMPDLLILMEREWSTILAGETYPLEEFNLMKRNLDVSTWIDARLEHIAGRVFVLYLKDGKRKQTMKLYANLNQDEIPQFKNKKKQAEALENAYKAILGNYQQQLDYRREEYAKQVSDLQEILPTFLDFASRFRSAPQKCLGVDAWITYFDKNKQRMERLYTYMNTIEDRYIPKAWSTGEFPLPKNRFVYPTPLVQGLRMNNFGVFNCDQIMRLGKVNKVLASYEDENNVKIEADHLYVVDYTINGVLSFNPLELTYNPNNPTALIVKDVYDQYYFFGKHDLKEMTIENGDVTIIKMQSIEVSTASDLRHYIGLRSIQDINTTSQAH
ncbi:MAG: OmpA family protein [Saprospiraceae bacterium]|nr:OmpA family protein [Saprospiraceae bacterium]